MVDYDEFITIVAQAADTGWARAEQATRAGLQTLAERIAKGEARDLAEQLPPELAPWLAATSDAQRFDVDEFVRRVAEREGVDADVAERDVRAVFIALGRALSPHELDDVASELSKDYAPLLPRGPQIEVMSADAFLKQVAERAGLDADEAQRATDVVLETLAERIAAGEVDDLLARLPLRLHPPLRRAATGEARRMDADEFVVEVAERHGIDADAARDQARAVLTTLREAVGDEFIDVAVELPRDYDKLLAR